MSRLLFRDDPYLRTARATVVAWFALLPVGLVFAASRVLDRSVFVPRYLMVAAPAWWLLMGVSAVAGISMGGMQTWMWGYMYPDLMDGLVPLASQPIGISGRNWINRRIRIEADAGGKRLIRVADDGCGMLRDDALLAFERHADLVVQVGRAGLFDQAALQQLQWHPIWNFPKLQHSYRH